MKNKPKLLHINDLVKSLCSRCGEKEHVVAEKCPHDPKYCRAFHCERCGESWHIYFKPERGKKEVSKSEI